MLSESTLVALVGFGIYLGMRLVDYMLPKGRHWTFIERFTRADDDPPDPDAE